MNKTTAISFTNVTLGYEKNQPVLKNVSFSIQSGERVALVGLNGSGKTTLLLAMVGIVPHTGEIKVANILLTNKSAAQVREHVGFLFNVPEDQLLFPNVLEDVAFSLLQRKTSKQEAFSNAQNMLHALGMQSLINTPLYHLSHGQKQKVALAGALITQPLILLLDEPTSGLDPIGKKQLETILINQDAAMVIATHDLHFAERVSTRCVFVHDETTHTHWSIPQISNYWNV